MTRLAALTLLGLALALSAGAEEWRFDAYNEVMSPFCPGRTLADCPSPQAAQLREWIAAQEAAGRDRADVQAELSALYGDAIRSTPRASGFGLAAYVIPVVLFLVGGGILFVFLRRSGRTPAAPAADGAGAAPDPELEALLERELGES